MVYRCSNKYHEERVKYMFPKKFENGQKVIDTITGFKGTITAVIEYMNGCIRYQIQPQIDEKGEYRESQIIDEQQLELIDKPKPKKKMFEREPPGGDRPRPQGYTLPKMKL